MMLRNLFVIIAALFLMVQPTFGDHNQQESESWFYWWNWDDPINDSWTVVEYVFEVGAVEVQHTLRLDERNLRGNGYFWWNTIAQIPSSDGEVHISYNTRGVWYGRFGVVSFEPDDGGVRITHQKHDSENYSYLLSLQDTVDHILDTIEDNDLTLREFVGEISSLTHILGYATGEGIETFPSMEITVDGKSIDADVVTPAQAVDVLCRLGARGDSTFGTSPIEASDQPVSHNKNSDLEVPTSVESTSWGAIKNLAK